MATEIVRIKVKETFSPEDMENVVAILSSSSPKGLQMHRWGRAVKDPHTAILFINWDSVAYHVAFTKTPEFLPLQQALYSLLPDRDPATIKMVHTHLQPSPSTKVFEAGNIGLSFIAKKPDTSREDFDAVVDKLLDGLTKANGLQSYFHGVQHEDENVFIALLGWDSVESHVAYNASRPDLTPALLSVTALENSYFYDIKLHSLDLLSNEGTT